MAAQCRSPRCTAERKGFRRELDSWRHRLIHCVGFESILEGLYGPGLRRDLSLFDDCEPEELVDWCIDDKCSLCNLRKDTGIDCPISVDSAESTPTEDLISQGQFNTENIECQAENYLNALFQKKDLPQNCDPNIPLAAQELLKKMIRQFAIEYISKSRKILQGNDDTLTDSAIAYNGIQLNQTQGLFQEQDGPLDLTVTRIEENDLQDEDGVLDLSLKRDCNGHETNGKITSKNGVIRICVLKKLAKSVRRQKRNPTALTGVLHSLCLYHKQQIRLMLQFLTEERRLCSNLCRKNEESAVTFQGVTRQRFTTRVGLKRHAAITSLPSVSVCLEDLRLTCPNLTGGSIQLDSKRSGIGHLESRNLVSNDKITDSRKNARSCLLSVNCHDAHSPSKRRKKNLSPLSGEHGIHLQENSVAQHQDNESKMAFSPIANISEKNSLLDVNENSIVQDLISFVTRKVNSKTHVAKSNSRLRELHATEKQSVDTVQFRQLVKYILNKTMQNGCSFTEVLNQYVKSSKGNIMQTRFRKRQETMLESESSAFSLTRRECLQIKKELCGLIETLSKKNKAARKNTKKRTKVLSNRQAHDVLVMENCGNGHRADTFRKDATELPQNNLSVDSMSVNCLKETCLPKHVILFPKSKITCEEKRLRSHIGLNTPKDCTSSKYNHSHTSGKFENSYTSQGDCCVQSTSPFFCKCSSRQISELFKGKVNGFPNIRKNIFRKLHPKVVIERLKGSVYSGNGQLSQPALHSEKHNPYNPERTLNRPVPRKTNSAFTDSQSFIKPLKPVGQRTPHSSVTKSKDNIDVIFENSVQGAKSKLSTTVSTESGMPLRSNRLCSPIKIMFLSNVDGAEGIKYSLSSVYVSPHETSSEKAAECGNDRQDGYSASLCDKSMDKRYLSLGSSPSHGCKRYRSLAKDSSKPDISEERPPARPKRVAPLVLKQIRNPSGASPKIQIAQNADNAEENRRNSTLCNRNIGNAHSGITLSIKFGSSTMKRCISRVNAPPLRGILCKKAQLPLPKINILPFGRLNSNETQDLPKSAENVSICNFEIKRTTRSNSASLQNPKPLSKFKKSVTFKGVQPQESDLPLSDTVPRLRQKRINPEQDLDWNKNKSKHQLSQREPFCNTRSLRSSVLRNCKLSSHPTLSTTLHSPPSTLSSSSLTFRDALPHNSKECSLTKPKLLNDKCERVDKVCELSSENARCLKSVVNNVLDTPSTSTFQPDIIKWWSSSSSKESLLQELDHRYEQIVNTWRKETGNETKSSSALQLSGPNQRSLVQTLFDKKYDTNDISVWFMETTETKSLSILPKANARQPLEINHNLGVKTRKKHTKRSRKRVKNINRLRCQRVWNLNHVPSTEDQSEDVCLKFVCTRKILAATVPEKCTLRKEVFKSPTSTLQDSQAVAKLTSALTSPNETPRVPRKTNGKLLDNESMTRQTRSYAKRHNDGKGCKAFLSKLDGVEGEPPKENVSSLKPLHPRNSTEQKKCTLRSHDNFKVNFSTKRNKGRYWSLSKTLSTTLISNNFNDEPGKRTGLRTYRRTAFTSPSMTWILERKRKRKRRGMVSTCGKISPKKSDLPSTTRKEDGDYSKLKLGPLKAIGLPSSRGLSSKGGIYSLTPIRISHHGTNTKA